MTDRDDGPPEPSLLDVFRDAEPVEDVPITFPTANLASPAAFPDDELAAAADDVRGVMHEQAMETGDGAAQDAGGSPE